MTGFHLGAAVAWSIIPVVGLTLEFGYRRHIKRTTDIRRWDK